MNKEPPKDSKIDVEQDIDSIRCIWRNGKKGISHYLSLAYVCFWFCGWVVMGFVVILFLIVTFVGFFTGKIPFFAPLFITFFLGAWIISGIILFKTIYFSLRPQKPSVLTLSKKGITFETGTRSPNLVSRKWSFSFKDFNNRAFNLGTSEMGTLKLDRAGEKQRLFFENGAERIEIGDTLTEPEREWLYNILVEHWEDIGNVLGEREMSRNPPEGSRIALERETSSTSYIWKNHTKDFGLLNVFLFLWLGGWTFVGLIVLTNGTFEKDEDRWFMLSWLISWTIGGIAVIIILYLTLRPQKPSILRLSSDKIHFETGTYSLSLFNEDYGARNPLAVLKKCKNKIYDIETSQINNLRIERVNEKQRLTFDYSGEKIEIGNVLTEPEREWLYNILKEHK